MKICVIGAGAIGGLMAARFAQAGEEVTVIDQGRHLAAIQERGLKLIWEDGEESLVTGLTASDQVDKVPPQDLVILAMKAHYLEQVARKLSAMLGPETMVMTVQNGIP